MRFLFITAFISIIFISFPSFSNAEALDLERSWQLMQENDPSLKAVEQTIFERMGEQTSARAAFLPRLNGDVSIRRYMEEEGFIWDSGTMGLGVLPFPATDKTVPSYSVALEQMVFDSGRSIAGFKAAEHMVSAAKHSNFAHRQHRALDLVMAYCRYYLAKKQLETVKTALSEYTELERVARLKYGQGHATKTDLLSAEVSKESSHLDVIEAEDNLKVAQKDLEVLIGETPHEIETPQVPNPPARLPEQLDRPELKAKTAEMNAARMEANKAGFSYLPELYAKVQAAYIDDGYRINKQQYTILGGMRWPFFDGAYNVGHRKAALAQAARNRWEKEAMENVFSVELLDAKQTWERSNREIEISKLNKARASENLRDARLGYAEGMNSSLDVRDAVRLWSEAELKYYQTICNKQLSAAKLRQTASLNILEP